MLLSSKQKNGNRLEFDNQLTSDLSKYAQRTRRAIPVFTITLCAMLLLALAVWASQTVQMPSWSWFRNNGNLDKICLDIAEALRSGSVTQPLPDCADSEQGITV